MSSNWKNSIPSVIFKRREAIVPSTTHRSADERKAILEKRIIEFIALGWTVEHKSDFDVVIKTGKRPNHILHLLLSLVSFGFWLPVWLLLSISMGKRLQRISIDEFGNSLIG